MKTLKFYLTISLVTLIAACSAIAQNDVVPTPESIIGFKLGSDYKLANWDQIAEYFYAIGKASNKIKIVELGKTEMGNTLLIALISSPENLKNLEKYKAIQHKLADPRLTSDAELPHLLKEGKTVVHISCCLHSSEVGATQMAPIVAYQLATENTPAINQILENVILILYPCVNPDGTQLVANHYMKQNPGPGVRVTSLPRLYNKYTGHDNNRDFYMFTQKGHKLVAKQLYEEWFPEIVFDMHQKGSGFDACRIFVPPFADPVNPTIHPLVIRQQELVGGYMSTDLTAGGYPWVQDHSQFTLWWHGGLRTSVAFHNMIAILTEVASANLASPITPSDARTARTRRSRRTTKDSNLIMTVDYPVKWKGDRTWRLADIVEQDRLAVFAVLKAAARNRDMILRNFYIMNKDAIEKGKTEKPFAYVMTAGQHDIGAFVYLLEVMLMQDTDFHIATKPFTAGAKQYPANSIILYLAQPARPNILALMEKQIFPSGKRPYDVAGWTLPLLMGVLYDRIDKPFTAETTPYTKAVPITKVVSHSKPKAYYIGVNSIDHFRAVNRLLKKGHSLSILTSPSTINGHKIDPGSMVVKNQNNAAKDIELLKKDLSLTIIEADSAGASAGVAIRKPRIAVVDNPRSMPVGWLRWLLEKHDFDYTLINSKDFEQGNLNSRFDVILFIERPGDESRDWRRRRSDRGDRNNTEQKQKSNKQREKYAEQIRQFVKAGGTVVAWANLADYMIETLNMDINTVSASRDREKFGCPGSVLKIEVNTSHPVTYGMQKDGFAFFRNSRVLKANRHRVLGKYPNTNPLASGYLLGANVIQGTDNIIYDTIGKGKAVIISFEPVFRDRPVGTFKLVFNSILYSVIPPAK